MTAIFSSPDEIGIVTGIAEETKLALRLSRSVLCAGGNSERALLHARQLVKFGATSLMSFGIAGGLAPGLQTGTVIVASEVITEEARYPAMSIGALALRARTGPIYGGTEIVATAQEKAELFARTSAIAVDLESGAVARVAAEAGIPFISLRVIADPAHHGLPPAALLPLSEKGHPRFLRVFWSILTEPGQISQLMVTAREAKVALEALRRARRRLIV
jgi:adenosylhomocysteine nucleosidase